MPFFSIQTNVPVENREVCKLAARASNLAAKFLGKPESYVQVLIETGKNMLHGGTDEPAAHVELNSIGLKVEQCAPLSETICAFLEKELSIKPERVYIEFKELDRPWVGWNSGTF